MRKRRSAGSRPARSSAARPHRARPGSEIRVDRLRPLDMENRRNRACAMQARISPAVRHTCSAPSEACAMRNSSEAMPERHALRFRETERLRQRHVVARAASSMPRALPAAVGGHEDREEAAAKPARGGLSGGRDDRALRPQGRRARARRRRGGTRRRRTSLWPSRRRGAGARAQAGGWDESGASLCPRASVIQPAIRVARRRR
jgi:hypothetical protein